MSPVDLSELRIDDAAAKPRRPLGPSILAAAVLLLIVTVGMTFVWPLIQPPREVATASIRTMEVASASSSLAVAEAVGWVEPDPYPTIVKPLVSGRIEKIEVLEGHEVVAGETLLASLESAALSAAHDRGRALLAERDSDHAVALAQHQKAVAHRKQLAGLRSALSNAQLKVADKETALATAHGNARRLGATARAATAAREAQERLTAEGTGHAVALERARAESAAADAAAATAVAEVATTERELAAANDHLALQQELYDNPVDLDSDVRIAKAQVELAEKRRDSAATDVAVAERELAWAQRVVAPVSGVVLRLIASPGETTGPQGEGLVALYDPKKLQARLDVPLDSVAGIHTGQRVELHSEITGSLVVQGTVQRIQHETDLLKNTLQVKVTLIDPPAIWRPETLCRARFLGGGQDPGSTASERTFVVPSAAVHGDEVFVFDPSRGVARAIAVTVLSEDNGQTLVKGELSIAQRVIIDEVEDGEAVQEKQP